MSFEQAMQRLEEIIGLLSDKATTLEQSLSLYAEGARLIELCSTKLSEARLTFETLMPKDEDHEV